jgi:dehydrogenase/reductase SDR family protein 7B
MTFAGSTVWITGASSGIGEALAYELSGRGARLILSARRADELERVAKGCADAEVLPVDMGDREDVRIKTTKVADRVDIAILAAGISQRSLARETSPDVDRRLMEVNYLGVVELTKALLPSMLARGHGQLVPISSVAGKLGTPLRSGYSASKHALHGFFESLRAELRADENGKGIDVTIVCPGFIRTQISMNALRGDGQQNRQMDHAVTRGMRADECARQIANAIAKRKEEVFVGGLETWAVWIHDLFPRIFSRLIARAKVT